MKYSPPIRIELPSIFGMKTVNAYLFKEPEPVLIDCGEKTPGSWEVLTAKLKEEGLKISDLKKLIITHAHVDHMGAAGWICEESEAEVLLPIYAKDWAINLQSIRQRRIGLVLKTFREYEVPEDSIIFQTMRRMLTAFQDVWDPLDASRLKFIQDKDLIEMGGKSWEVLYTPGHCNNQCCFYQEEEEHLISSDMLLSITPTPVIDTSLEPPYQRVKGILQFLESMERLKKLAIKEAFPGHYDTVKNIPRLIEYQVNRIHMRKTEVLGYLAEENIKPHDIFLRMYGENFTGWSMLLGYLDLLEKEGKIERNLNNSIIEISRI